MLVAVVRLMQRTHLLSLFFLGLGLGLGLGFPFRPSVHESCPRDEGGKMGFIGLSGGGRFPFYEKKLEKRWTAFTPPGCPMEAERIFKAFKALIIPRDATSILIP